MCAVALLRGWHVLWWAGLIVMVAFTFDVLGRSPGTDKMKDLAAKIYKVVACLTLINWLMTVLP